MRTHSKAPLFLLCTLLAATMACDGVGGVPFLASWSPDGASVAFVPDHFNHRAEQESGVWVLDAETGVSRRIFEAPAGWRCVQPQWSPSGDEVAFLLVGEGEGVEGKEIGSFRVLCGRPQHVVVSSLRFQVRLAGRDRVLQGK